jgi:uncharacterized protein YukE
MKDHQDQIDQIEKDMTRVTGMIGTIKRAVENIEADQRKKEMIIKDVKMTEDLLNVRLLKNAAL